MKNELTHDELLRQLRYEPDTGKFFWRVSNSRRVSVGDEAGTVRPDGYRKIMVLGAPYRAHRLAWLYMNGAWPRNYTDHINGHKDDNRIANLRQATKSENGMNRSAPRNNTSGFKGVSWNENAQKWAARCQVEGHDRYLGIFHTKEQASAAYEAFARKTFGEFYKPSRSDVSTLSFGITE